MTKFLFELIYPSVCGVCNEINKEDLCEECRLKIKKMEKNKIDNYINKNFNRHFYIFKYDNQIRDLLLNYKFNDKVYLFKTFSKIIIDNKKAYDYMKNYDIIIPIPLHKEKYNKRGYNQCELILKELNNNLRELNIKNNILIKNKNNRPQSTLDKNERMNNIKDVYIIKNKEIIKNKKILLFDDIFTTGSTANECARILKENEVKEIGIFTIAKD